MSFDAIKNKYFAISLDDYGTAAFCSFGTLYIDTLDNIKNYVNCYYDKSPEFAKTLYDDIQSYLSGNENIEHDVAFQKKLLINPCLFYGLQSCKSSKCIDWKHINVWNYPYCMRSDGYKNTHIWIKCNNKFLRCIKPQFINLRYAVNDELTDFNHVNWYWGQPCMIYRKNNVTTSRLYIIEKYFSSYEEMKIDYFAFNEDKADYTNFCNDIFADG